MLEYGKSGIYNNNRLPAEKKKEEKEKENTRDRSVPDGSDKKTEDTMLNYIGEGIQQFQDDVN